MYSYDRTAAGTPQGTLRVEKTGPVEFEYLHPQHGKVRIVWSDKGWFAVPKDHRIHPLGFNGITPVGAGHPNAQKALMLKTDEVLGSL